MNEMQSPLDRLEARIDYQAKRIDALYAMLEERGILHRRLEARKSDALFDELLRIEDAPLAREMRAHSSRRPMTRLRVGEATGV